MQTGVLGNTRDATENTKDIVFSACHGDQFELSSCGNTDQDTFLSYVIKQVVTFVWKLMIVVVMVAPKLPFVTLSWSQVAKALDCLLATTVLLNMRLDIQ